jgi:hypothetical protein
MDEHERRALNSELVYVFRYRSGLTARERLISVDVVLTRTVAASLGSMIVDDWNKLEAAGGQCQQLPRPNQETINRFQECAVPLCAGHASILSYSFNNDNDNDNNNDNTNGFIQNIYNSGCICTGDAYNEPPAETPRLPCLPCRPCRPIASIRDDELGGFASLPETYHGIPIEYEDAVVPHSTHPLSTSFVVRPSAVGGLGLFVRESLSWPCMPENTLIPFGTPDSRTSLERLLAAIETDRALGVGAGFNEYAVEDGERKYSFAIRRALASFANGSRPVPEDGDYQGTSILIIIISNDTGLSKKKRLFYSIFN